MDDQLRIGIFNEGTIAFGNKPFDHKAAFDRKRSEAAKERGQQLAVKHLEIWKAEALEYITNHIGEEITAEDIEASIGQPTDLDGRPNNAGVGGFIAGLARKGVLIKVGWTKSQRISNHGSDLRLWRIVTTP